MLFAIKDLGLFAWGATFLLRIKYLLPQSTHGRVFAEGLKPLRDLNGVKLKDGISTSLNARAAVVISQSVEQEVAILDGRGSVSIHGENQLLNQSYRLQS